MAHAKKSSQNTWIREIEYLRGFAILGVLSVHTSANFTQAKHLNNLVIFNILIDVLSHYAVPLFIFISGFVLSIKYYDAYSEKVFYLKRMKSIIPAYIIFSILYILFFAIFYGYPSPLRILFEILTASSSYHMWFFAIIMQFYFFYPIIIKIYRHFDERNKINIFLICCLFMQITWIILSLILQTVVDKHWFTLLLNRVFISHIFYFILGVYVNKNFEAVKENLSSIKTYKFTFLLITIPLILTSIISFFWVTGLIRYAYFYKIPPIYFIISNILEPVNYLFVFIFLFEASRYFMKRKNVVSYVIHLAGKYSFGIYLIHVFFITMTTKFLDYFGISVDNWIFYPLLFFVTFVSSLFSVYLMSYLPYSDIIVGTRLRKIPLNK